MRRLLPTLAIVLTLTACHDAVGPVETASTAARGEDMPVLRLAVAPATTDPGITVALDDHVVRVPASHHTGNLLVYLPSSRATPATAEYFMSEAARLGYHVIGLMYPNNPGLVSFCAGAGDPNACYELTRIEVITGEPVSSFVDVDQANSIDNRLTKLLQWLKDNRPGEGWSSFMTGNTIKWHHVVLAGHSQGAGHAVMIAKLRKVARVIMLSGVTDAIGGVAAPWVGLGETPADRFFGLVHKQDNQFRPGVLNNWIMLGMDAFGPIVAPELSAPPYGGTHRLMTDILPSNGSYVAPAPHGSTGVDIFTPILTDGSPALRPVWQYLLGFCLPAGLPGGGTTGPLVPCHP